MVFASVRSLRAIVRFRTLWMSRLYFPFPHDACGDQKQLLAWQGQKRRFCLQSTFPTSFNIQPCPAKWSSACPLRKAWHRLRHQGRRYKTIFLGVVGEIWRWRSQWPHTRLVPRSWCVNCPLPVIYSLSLPYQAYCWQEDAFAPELSSLGLHKAIASERCAFLCYIEH